MRVFQTLLGVVAYFGALAQWNGWFGAYEVPVTSGDLLFGFAAILVMLSGKASGK